MASGTGIANDRVWLCRSCGVEYGRSASPPERCAICTDEREVWPAKGQAWTSLDELDDGDRRVVVDAVEPKLWGLSVEPTVGLGQRALLVQTDAGNLLWDVPGFVNAAAVSEIRDLGGLAAIVASHPHMYGAQFEWSAAFGDAPVLVAAKDAHWLGRREPAIHLWDEPFEVLPGIHLLQPGGHFPGSTVALWTDTADGGNALLSGDTVMACPDQGWVTFMRSFPNAIPLSAAVVRRVADSVRDLRFDRLYDNFAGTVSRDAAAAVQRSAERYIAWVSGANDHLT